MCRSRRESGGSYLDRLEARRRRVSCRTLGEARRTGARIWTRSSKAERDISNLEKMLENAQRHGAGAEAADEVGKDISQACLSSIWTTICELAMAAILYAF